MIGHPLAGFLLHPAFASPSGASHTPASIAVILISDFPDIRAGGGMLVAETCLRSRFVLHHDIVSPVLTTFDTVAVRRKPLTKDRGYRNLNGGVCCQLHETILAIRHPLLVIGRMGKTNNLSIEYLPFAESGH